MTTAGYNEFAHNLSDLMGLDFMELDIRSIYFANFFKQVESVQQKVLKIMQNCQIYAFLTLPHFLQKLFILQDKLMKIF